VRSSVKSSYANDNFKDELIARTRQVWQPRLGRDVSCEDARRIAETVTGFFAVLAEWSNAERRAANDNEAPSTPDDCEVRHDR
jgi:hypothetical protein